LNAKKESFNKNKKIPVKPLVIVVNRYKDTFRLYYIFTNNKGDKMRRKKAEFARVYENGSEYTKYVIGYKVINIPRFQHKKKPISMIKALNVRDRINNKKPRWLY